VTWVTSGKLLLRYPYDARALVRGITAKQVTGGATVPLDTKTHRRVRHDTQSDNQELLRQGGPQCGAQKAVLINSSNKTSPQPRGK